MTLCILGMTTLNFPTVVLAQKVCISPPNGNPSNTQICGELVSPQSVCVEDNMGLHCGKPTSLQGRGTCIRFDGILPGMPRQNGENEVFCGTQVQGAAAIQVMEATYGGNCRVSRGNVTQHIASACNGRNSCTYTIDYTIIGDPAYGCAKDYSAQWRCGVNQKTYSAFASPEAGYRKTIQLTCP